MADSLQPNQSLGVNQKITSLNGIYNLVYQPDGNLVVYKNYPNGSSKALWASNTNGKPGKTCVMQGDGNLVIYNAANKAIWSSNTFHDPGSRLVIQDDGNLVIYKPNNKAIWATNTIQKSVPSGPLATNFTMLPGTILKPGTFIHSQSMRFRFTLQTDGNLVLYKLFTTGGSKALWASNTNGKPSQVCIMQPDGNLVIYDVDGNAIWSSNTFHDSGSSLVLQDDGNVVIYKPNHTPAWSTNTFMQSVNLHIKILTPPTSFFYIDMIKEMTNIYFDAGFNVNHKTTEWLAMTNPVLAPLNDIDTGSCTSGNPSAEQNMLSNFRNNATSKDVVAYMCRSVSKNNGVLNGCASYPANRPMVVVASYASLYTLAHEVGHVLGLSHVNDNKRLMTGNGTAYITNLPPDITAAEAVQMQLSPYTV